jgi:two-component system chemotaxis response regulator CheB
VPAHDIVVIGASAGGVEAISKVVAGLPRDLKAAVFVVLHLSRGRSVLPEILTRAGRLPAKHPIDGELIQHGRIYVAVPDHHLTIEDDHVRVLHGPTENSARPAVDPLFRSAARTYGSRVIGIVLTGSLDDGTSGLAAVKEAGGIAVVQDPEEAFAPSMPRSALEFVQVDHVLPLHEISGLVVSLVREESEESTSRKGPHLRQLEADLRPPDIPIHEGDRPGRMAVVTCPECHGALWETDEESILRFRCRVGHAYSAESMLSAQTDGVDRALWVALRSLEERAALTRRMADRARRRQQGWVARAFDQRAQDAADHASVVRSLLHTRTSGHVVLHTNSDDEIPAAVSAERRPD